MELFFLTDQNYICFDCCHLWFPMSSLWHRLCRVCPQNDLELIIISHDVLVLHHRQCSRDVSRFSRWAQPSKYCGICCLLNMHCKDVGWNVYIYIYKPLKNMYLPSPPKKSPSLARDGIASPAFPSSLHQLQALWYYFDGSWITDAQRMGYSWELASRSIGLLCQGESIKRGCRDGRGWMMEGGCWKMWGE